MQEQDSFSALFLKKWRENRPKNFNLKTEEGQMAEFGDTVMAMLSDHWTENEVDPMETLDRLLYVPGEWVCPTCQFRLSQRILYAQSGDVGINRAEPKPCPNDGTAMRKVTWKQEAEVANKFGLDIAKENQRLRERLDELELRH